MFKKLQKLSKNEWNKLSFASTIALEAAAIGISFAYHYFAGADPANVLLILVFFLIIVSYRMPGYLYGIGYSFFAVLWLRFLYSSAFGLYPITFAGMCAVAVLTNTTSFRLLASSAQVVEYGKQSAETEIEKMRSDLLRSISHDLRTPLAGIVGNSLVYLENKLTLSEIEKINVVTSIHKDSAWLMDLTENLLAITRIRNNTMAINVSEELVEEVIGAALQKTEKRHPDRIVRVKIPDDFIMLPMDAILIEQVTVNLLENAMLHSCSAEPVDILIENEPEYVSFTVRDYGCGIPENMQNSLFQGVAYSSPHNADALRGIGVGLAICKTIITAHHGTIQGRNHEHGAEFIFTLPKGTQEGMS